jgi:phosphotransferase family enzyme
MCVRSPQQRAIPAAQAVAARYGIDATAPRILQDSNHTVIHLAPAPVVAKVDTSPEESSLAGEIEVARFLGASGGPVVPPTPLFPAGPHEYDGLQMTFWEYSPHEAREPDPAVLGRSLRTLHDALAAYPEPLPAWDRFDGMERVLMDDRALSSLSPDDRAFLRHRYDELLAAMSAFRPVLRPLHGEPHAGNLLFSPEGPRWIDFESACLGPQEWDLTVLPDEIAARHFTAVDWELLRLLKQMRSLCVAVWCWLDPDRAPVLRDAGTYHLSLLRGSS